MRAELKKRIDFKKLKKVCASNNVLAIYLYGSQLTGKTDQYSDLDLGVLFFPEDTEKLSSVDFYMGFKAEISDAFNFPEIDLVFMQNSSIKLNFNIITTGEVIYSANEEARLKYEDIAICKGLDFKAELDLYYKELMEVVERGDLVGR